MNDEQQLQSLLDSVVSEEAIEAANQNAKLCYDCILAEANHDDIVEFKNTLVSTLNEYAKRIETTDKERAEKIRAYEITPDRVLHLFGVYFDASAERGKMDELDNVWDTINEVSDVSE